MGDPFGGIAVAFSRDVFGGSPIHVASFGLLLLENLDNISFQILASPNGMSDRPIIAGCDEFKSIIEVDGRAAAINYPSAD